MILQEANRLADPISNVPGLIWKIWIQEDEPNLVGGIYLFENQDAMSSFVDGPIAARIHRQADVEDIKMTSFNILESPSKKTHAPHDVFSPGNED